MEIKLCRRYKCKKHKGGISDSLKTGHATGKDIGMVTLSSKKVLGKVNVALWFRANLLDLHKTSWESIKSKNQLVSL